jgi:hypothetical protein
MLDRALLREEELVVEEEAVRLGGRAERCESGCRDMAR